MLTMVLSNPFQTMITPITNLINMAFVPALSLVVAIGAVFAIVLGVRLAKAEEPQEREKAKSQLKNFIIGFIIIFVLVVLLRVGSGAMSTWADSAVQSAT